MASIEPASLDIGYLRQFVGSASTKAIAELLDLGYVESLADARILSVPHFVSRS